MKLKLFLGAVLAFLAVGVSLHIAEARLIGQTALNTSGANRDLWCNGGRLGYSSSGSVTTLSATEICQDYLGNWIPTTTAGQDLGTSSLQWRNLFMSGTLTSGSQSITGNESVSGSLGVGSLTAPTTSQLSLTALTASTTGQIIVTQPSATADALDFVSNATLTIQIGPNGHLLLRKYAKTAIDTLVPDHGVGDMIIDTNGTLANQVCIATGTAVAQWRALQGPAALGCGSGN